MRLASLLATSTLALTTPALALAAPPAPASSSAPAPPPAPTGDVQLTDQGLTTTLPDGVVVSFEPSTTARWVGSGKLANEAAKWTQGFHLDLSEGEIDVSMPEGPTGAHALLVSTRAGTLTVWRGHMHVTVRGDSTALSVYDGALVVGSNRQSFPVRDAGAVVLHKGGDAEKGRTMPAAPGWDGGVGAPPPFAVVPEGSAATLGFGWASAPGAASYRVQIGTDGKMNQIVRRSAIGDPRFSVPAPPAGVHYFAQVRSVGTDGIVGPWSSVRALRIAHYRLPTGAFVARDGAVVLPYGASVALTDGDGLELAYENVRPGPPPLTAPILYWSKVEGPLRVADDAPVRVVHLRDGALGVEARVVLAKRELRASVEMKPRQAKATDPIDVRVVVADPSGRVDVASETITLEAMKDLDSVPVAWQRTGNVWTGRIGPRSGTFASVVRVVVKDGLALEIGRGFVEIPSSNAPSR